jgi:hypothetical protein
MHLHTLKTHKNLHSKLINAYTKIVLDSVGICVIFVAEREVLYELQCSSFKDTIKRDAG